MSAKFYEGPGEASNASVLPPPVQRSQRDRAGARPVGCHLQLAPWQAMMLHGPAVLLLQPGVPGSAAGLPLWRRRKISRHRKRQQLRLARPGTVAKFQ